ncbi:uncharacterized protein Tco025E_04256 [Trypanosoma conorhini]|uniref:Uncharacterized protein n=1 Tax=Trypanosoma conorhini TaxID=83891 RepID=A0A3R7L145_9TRYP|nr:uncharacterized protein Tco025E_04256 [Trypanosoma conorhini]RNF19009.1 hypothetical protein Tco025E_04256 [Trypanosoma conorhini]
MFSCIRVSPSFLVSYSHSLSEAHAQRGRSTGREKVWGKGREEWVGHFCGEGEGGSLTTYRTARNTFVGMQLGGSPPTEGGARFRDAVTGMHHAATQRARLLEDLATLCKALVVDVNRFASREAANGLGDVSSCKAPRLCALEALRQLRPNTAQGGVDRETAGLASSRHVTFRASASASSSRGPAEPHPTRRNSAATGDGVSPRSRDGESRNANLESLLRPREPLSSLEAAKNGENNHPLLDMMQRRDALRSELALLKADNERAALCQDRLKRSVRLSARAARVVALERDVFTTLGELFTALLRAGEDWLTTLQKVELSPAVKHVGCAAGTDTTGLQAAEEVEEVRLRSEIREQGEARCEAAMARQTAEVRAHSTRVSVAALRQGLHELQTKWNSQREEGHQRQLSLLHLEAAAVKAESQYAKLRLKYARRFVSRLQLHSSEGNESGGDFARALPSAAASAKERMDEAFARLRSIVVNYETDLPKLKQLNRILRRGVVAAVPCPRGEQLFREKHQEIKTALLPCFSQGEERDAFRSVAHHGVQWPLTLARLKSSFPSHCVEPVHNALLTLVLVWGQFAPAERQRTCTTMGDLAVNAHLLLMVANYVESRRRRR